MPPFKKHKRNLNRGKKHKLKKPADLATTRCHGMDEQKTLVNTCFRLIE